MTNFVRNIDAVAALCDELIAAGCTPFLATRTETPTALQAALDDRVGLLIVPRDDNAIGIAAGISLAGGCPAVLLSDAGVTGCSDAIASLVGSHQTPLLLVLSIDHVEGTTRRLTEALMAELGIQSVAIEATERLSARVRQVRDIVRDDQRPAALLVPLDTAEWGT